MGQQFYEQAEVAAVTDTGIAQDIERLERLDYALGENHQADGRTTSDFGSEDGRVINRMEEDIIFAEKRKEHPFYDFAVLYSLQQSGSPFSAVTRIPTLRAVHKGDQVKPGQLERLLEIDGYERVGGVFVPRNEKAEPLIPTIGAFAAASFMKALPKLRGMDTFVARANKAGVELTETNLANLAKNDPLTLEFYKRRPAIEAAKLAINQLAPTREVEASGRTWSVFDNRVNKPEDTDRYDTTWWWSELKFDLARIEDAAFDVSI